MYDSRLDKAARLSSFLPRAAPASPDRLPLELCLFDDAQLSVVYAPLDQVNTGAQLVLAGLTPGWRQAYAAYAAHAAHSRDDGRAARDDGGAAREIKQRVTALTGRTRENLIGMLDALRLNEHLGLSSTAALFGDAADALHWTSVLRYPVFKGRKSYSGQHPRPVAHPFLRAMLERLCAPELASVPGALIVPLGKAAEEGLEYLTALGLLDRERWLRGFPHPSGANGHRRTEFSRAQAGLEWQVEAWFSRNAAPAASEERPAVGGLADEWQDSEAEEPLSASG